MNVQSFPMGSVSPTQSDRLGVGGLWVLRPELTTVDDPPGPWGAFSLPHLSSHVGKAASTPTPHPSPLS